MLKKEGKRKIPIRINHYYQKEILLQPCIMSSFINVTRTSQIYAVFVSILVQNMNDIILKALFLHYDKALVLEKPYPYKSTKLKAIFREHSILKIL